MSKKVTLTSPETRPNITEVRLSHINILNPVTGECECVLSKYDSNGAQAGNAVFQVTVPASDMNAFVQALITQAQTDGKIAAGTVGDV